jgi:small GTP-binding protein
MGDEEKKIRYKIVVGGHFNSGKTTFIKTLTGGEFLSSEKKTHKLDEHHKKEQTTVAMDFATFEDEGVKYALFGLPGQYRFNFMWEILARGAHGFLLLIDSTDPTKWPELFRQLYLFKKLNPNAVILFAATKQDLPNALPPEKIAQKLNFLRRGQYEIVPLVATDYDSALRVLRKLREMIEERGRRESKLTQ